MRINLHPSRILTLKPGESFDIDSGLGGSFTVRLDRIEGDLHHFTITSSSPPPEGWKGEKRQFRIEDLTTKLFLCVSDSPYYDGGVKYLAAYRHLGYPEDSPEIQRLRRQCPKLPA